MTPSLRSAVIHGTLWTVASRCLVRMLGVISIAILARVLGPADFGLVAMASLVIGLVEIFMAFGVESALIQNRSAGKDHYDTAWTIRLLQGIFVASLVVLTAPLAQAYFNEPRLGMLLPVLASAVVISSLSNIGVVMYRKELQFDKEFRVAVATKLIAFPIPIAAAFLIGNYWALAVGIVGACTVACIVSYAMHPFRPRLSLVEWRELWSFSQWLLVLNLVQYGERRTDEIIVGRYTGTTEMGLYSVASELGQLPSAELAAPVNRVLYPAFSQLQSEPARLAAAYGKALAMVAAMTIPAGLGLALVAPEAVRLLLGTEWLGASALLAVLAVQGALRSISSSAGYVLLATGRPRLDAAVACATLLALIAGAALAVSLGAGPIGIALAKLAAAVVSVALAWTFLVRLTQVTVRTILSSTIRPLAAGATMAALILSLPENALGVTANLLLKIALGAGTYLVTLWMLWLLARCPEGPERVAIDFAKRLLAVTRSRASAAKRG